MVEAILVGADDSLNARVDTGLSAGCSLLDTHLGHTCLDSLGHTAELLDILYMLPSLVNEFVGECFHII